MPRGSTDRRDRIPQAPNFRSKRGLVVRSLAKSSLKHSSFSALPLAYIRPKFLKVQLKGLFRTREHFPCLDVDSDLLLEAFNVRLADDVIVDADGLRCQ